MLSEEEHVEAEALRARGWSVSQIARHLHRDPKTIRAYLSGKRKAGARRPGIDDAFARFEPYIAQRLTDDHGLAATVLLRELRAVGYDCSYQTLTREVRERDLRPHCEACAGVKGRATIEIDHEPGEETQWDWLELPDAPWGGSALLQVGALSASGKCRAVFAEAKRTEHLIVATQSVLRRLGGLTASFRIDHMEGAVIPATRKLVPAYADYARYLKVSVVICPARRGNRKGVVEKTNDYITQSWWRTADVATPEQAQASLDAFCEKVADQRPRGDVSVGELARAERLRRLPTYPYPVSIEVARKVSWSALISYEGNRYSVPPGYVNDQVVVSRRMDEHSLEIRSMSGEVLARHRMAPAGAGALCRSGEHRLALQEEILSGFSMKPPCQRKRNRPPSGAAKQIAAQILHPASPSGDVDLSYYEELTR
jgi:transposase